MFRRRIVLLVVGLAGFSVVGACEKDGTNGPSSIPQNSPRSYVGSVSLPGGVTGLVMLSATTGSSSLARTGLIDSLLDLIQPTVFAQSSASGTLTLSDSTAAVLTGTYTGGAFQMSGGGFTVSATVSGASLSGTVSGPQGAGPVAAMSPAAPVIPAPANSNGEYVGTYAMTVQGYYLNVGLPAGQLVRNCGVTYVISGTLALGLESGGRIAMSDQWREEMTIASNCPDVTQFVNIIQPPPGSDSGGDFTADLANIQISDFDQFPANGGTGIRTITFVGGFTAPTRIQGRFLKTFRFAGPANTTEHREGYNVTETTVTLQKR
jgi:hypothetical protein